MSDRIKSLPKLKKSWGQHILVNRAVLEGIASEVKNCAGDNPVIEFASGTGNLTEYLIKVCKKVIAVEMEREMLKSLKERFGSDDRVEIVEKNMMNFDFDSYFRRFGRLVIAGNLPYNLSKLFLFKLFDKAEYIKDAILMFQLEVAERIVAQSGDRNYSAISVFAHTLAKPEIIMKVSKSSFVPPPRVESGVVHLNFYDDSERILLYKGYNKIVQGIFNYPRKTMRNIIRFRFGEEFLGPLSKRIDLNKRPMELTLSEIEFIYRVINGNEK